MKKYSIPFCVFLGGMFCFLTFSFIGSSVSADGTLIEPFFLVPMGWLFFMAAMVTGTGLGLWSLFLRPVKIDKWVFGVSSSLLVIFALYITASMAFLFLRDQREISLQPQSSPTEIRNPPKQ